MELIKLFAETKNVIETGCYQAGHGTVYLRHTSSEHKQAQFVPSGQQENAFALGEHALAAEPCTFEVVNEDALAYASRLLRTQSARSSCVSKPPLVLNFANPTIAGGGVHVGARAQEEDLCRKSTLYASLSSEAARPFYQHHKNMSSCLFSDDIVLSPCVEVFRDAGNALLDEPFTVSVLTLSAPLARRLGYFDVLKLEKVLKRRILRMLRFAVACNYETLVLGAWGCGAFGNDPHLVSKVFFDAFHELEKELCACGMAPVPGAGSAFRHVGFVVLDETEHHINFNCFSEVFERYYELWNDAVYDEKIKGRTIILTASGSEDADGFGDLPVQEQACPSPSASCDRRGIEKGDVANGRYEIHRCIGEGGMSKVFLASDRQCWNKLYAIKEMSRAGSIDVAAVSVMVGAARLLSGINHPFVAGIHGFWETEGYAYIVMDYLEGETLDEKVRREGPLEEVVVRKLMLELCDALGYLHRQNPPIIHRDVKPHNVLLCVDGHIRLVDSLIARQYREGLAKDAYPRGTVGYAAPEQYGLAQTDARSDLFAVGATMWHLLAGKAPDSSFCFPDVREINPLVSAWLAREVVPKCVHPDRAERYQSCRELAVALRRY